MASITDVIVNFGEIFELNLPIWDQQRCMSVIDNHTGWVHYNPRKKINRQGLSVTSLDGGYSGIPDLDSLREFNIINNTSYNENHFKTRTSIVDQIPEVKLLLDLFPDHGRCHFLRLNSGGFFPPHRDNGTANAIPSTFRLIVPVFNFEKYHMNWIQDGQVVEFRHGTTYFVNTTKTHSLFSYTDNCISFIMNVVATHKSLQTLIQHCLVK